MQSGRLIHSRRTFGIFSKGDGEVSSPPFRDSKRGELTATCDHSASAQWAFRDFRWEICLSNFSGQFDWAICPDPHQARHSLRRRWRRHQISRRSRVTKHAAGRRIWPVPTEFWLLPAWNQPVLEHQNCLGRSISGIWLAARLEYLIGSFVALFLWSFHVTICCPSGVAAALSSKPAAAPAL